MVRASDQDASRASPFRTYSKFLPKSSQKYTNKLHLILALTYRVHFVVGGGGGILLFGVDTQLSG